MAKILIIEDDVDLANMLRVLFNHEGYIVEVLHDGLEAVNHLRTYKYDILIMDWVLPGLSGIEVCRQFRSFGGLTPIMFLTGKITVKDKIDGFDAGADDYVTKPFDMEELPPRVRALLRRPQITLNEQLAHKDLVLDSSRRTVMRAGEYVGLTKREYQVLEFFMRNPNQVYSYETLLDRIWPSSSEATTLALRTIVKRLRLKVDPDGHLFRTIHGVGYILETK